MVLRRKPTLRFWRGLRERRGRLGGGCRAVLRRRRLLLRLAVLALLQVGRGLRLLLAASPPAPRPAARLLGRRQIVGEGVGDSLQRSELLTRRVDQLIRARGVALGRGEQSHSDLERLLPGRVDQLRRVLLVPMPARVRERAEEPLRLRELRARAAVLHLASRARESPDPAREDLVRRVGLPFADRPEQDADALNTVFVP